MTRPCSCLLRFSVEEPNLYWYASEESFCVPRVDCQIELKALKRIIDTSQRANKALGLVKRKAVRTKQSQGNSSIAKLVSGTLISETRT